MKYTKYWRNEIDASGGNMKKLWRTLNGVLGEATAPQAEELTADDFAAFFRDKVEDVRSTTASTPLYDVPYRSTPTVDEWNAVTVDEIEKLIS